MLPTSNRATFSLFFSERWDSLARVSGIATLRLPPVHGICVQPWRTVRSIAYRKGLSPLFKQLCIGDDAEIPVLGPWNSGRFMVRALCSDPVTELNELLQSADRCCLAIPFLPQALGPRLAPEFAVLSADAEAYHLLPISWSAYEDYVVSLPSKVRSSLRAEDRRMLGVVSALGVERGAAAIAALEGLSNREAPHQTDVARNAARIFGDAFLSFYVADNSGYRALCVAIEHENELYLRRYVQRSDAARDGYSYFATVYRAPVEYAIKKGLVAVHAGLGASEIKSKRGFTALRQVHCLAVRRS